MHLSPALPVSIRNTAHWAAIESTPGLQDGFIRQFCDHGILQCVSDGGPAGRADGAVAPLRIERYRHEGIVLTNQLCVRGLDGLAARWELFLADGRTLTAPAELPPDLRPGQTAALPLPFELPRDGGDAWLTLRVTTAEDQPWAPPGTEFCAPRVRLRPGTPSCLVPAAPTTIGRDSAARISSVPSRQS